MRKPILATRVAPYINKSVRRLTKALGISISEYLRRLILQDFDSRKIFDDELKRVIEQSHEDEQKTTEIISIGNATKKPHNDRGILTIGSIKKEVIK